MANREAAKEQASLHALRAQGEERVMRQADEASQRRLGEAIQKTAEAEFLTKQKEMERCVFVSVGGRGRVGHGGGARCGRCIFTSVENECGEGSGI